MILSSSKSIAREYFESIIISVILALFIRTWLVQPFKIPTGSMEQTLLVGDHLLVNKFVFGPSVLGIEKMLLPFGNVSRGDVVVFKYPNEPSRDFIKRVIGLAGETLEVRDKLVYINGEPLNEEYLNINVSSAFDNSFVSNRQDNFGPVLVPDDHYFVMGDNRENSQDSRFWGPLPHSYLKGKAMVLYWSYDSAQSTVLAEPGLGATIRRLSSVILYFFTNSRWERTFRQVH
jgi:signal peptidase I